MGFFQRLFGARAPCPPLGLADPAHPARKWIDVATAIADRRIEVLEAEAGRTALRIDGRAIDDLAGALDMALAAAPEDPDLLTLRASARRLSKDEAGAQSDLRQALRADPKHVEASAQQRYGAGWNHVLFLPPWSPGVQTVHPILAARANAGDALHPVRHCLQVALTLVIVGSADEFGAKPLRHHWEVMHSETPCGPLGAHYAILDLGGVVRRQEFVLAPSTERYDPSDAPPSLSTRLGAARNCFIVLAGPDGRVHHNLCVDICAEQRGVLAKLAQRLLEASGLERAAIAKAMDWHTKKVDLDSVGFPGEA